MQAWFFFFFLWIFTTFSISQFWVIYNLFTNLILQIVDVACYLCLFSRWPFFYWFLSRHLIGIFFFYVFSYWKMFLDKFRNQKVWSLWIPDKWVLLGKQPSHRPFLLLAKTRSNVFLYRLLSALYLNYFMLWRATRCVPL